MYKFHLGRLFLLAVVLMSCLTSFAIPARRGLIQLQQPDGTNIPALLHGDEYNHYYTTPEGLPIIVDENGTFKVSDADPVLFRESMAKQSMNSPKRKVAEQRMLKVVTSRGYEKGYGLFPGTSFSSEGSPKALVILVEYSDIKFTLNNPYDYFSRMVNEPGFSDYGGTGSALDFFTENSGGMFTPVFDVVGPVTLSGTREYYGANDTQGNDIRAHMMVIEACRMLDSEIDFSEYDNDGDKIIDNVFVFFAGEAESSTGVKNQVWPHTGYISYSSPTAIRLDGVELDRYACSNEWNKPYNAKPGEKGRPDGVGTFVHEFSHVLGLPDLYSTYYNSAFTPGEWSALDYGPYNNDGCTPPNYSVFERYALGWLQPRVITGASNVRLETISHNQAAMIPTLKDTEFFLFENRQQQGWDAYIPGHGMLVWHIDYDETTWAMNAVNSTVSHQYVDIEEADGMRTEETRADDAFPSSYGRTQFNDNTIPSMLPWTGKSLNLPISDITEREDGIVTFKVAGGRPDVDIPVANAAKDITPGGFTASWTESAEAECTYVLNVYTRSGNSNIAFAPGFCNLNVGNVLEYVVTGLKSDTQYYYTISVEVPNGESEPSNEVAVRTDPPTFDYLTPEVLPASEISSTSFNANWKPMEGATEYFLYVTTPVPDGFLKDVCDFTGGISALNNGWTTDANSTYAISSNCGQAVPSLRFTKSEQTIESPAFTDGIKSVSFWSRGVSTNAGDYLLVELFDNLHNVLTSATYELVSTSGGNKTIINDIPQNVAILRITAKHTKGSIALDDIVIEHGTAYSDMALAGYDGSEASNSCSKQVVGLTPLTSYSYYVIASNGTLRSLPSDIEVLTTKEFSSVAAVNDAAVIIEVSGHQFTIAGNYQGFVKLYSVDGKLLVTKEKYQESVSFEVESSGVYLLVTDLGSTQKIIIK